MARMCRDCQWHAGANVPTQEGNYLLVLQNDTMVVADHYKGVWRVPPESRDYFPVKYYMKIKSPKKDMCNKATDLFREMRKHKMPFPKDVSAILSEKYSPYKNRKAQK